jgi:hypothetical protein
MGPRWPRFISDNGQWMAGGNPWDMERVRLEGWDGPMVQDAPLRGAPHHEADKACGVWVPAFAATTHERMKRLLAAALGPTLRTLGGAREASKITSTHPQT